MQHVMFGQPVESYVDGRHVISCTGFAMCSCDLKLWYVDRGLSMVYFSDQGNRVSVICALNLVPHS
jgi:hypothetical protein